jgi:hypothetical protein
MSRRQRKIGRSTDVRETPAEQAWPITESDLEGHMSARTTIATIATITALAAPAVATARPADPDIGGTAVAQTAPAVVESPAVPAVNTDTGGASTLLVLIIAGSALLVGVAVATGTGRMRARHGVLRS